MSYVHAIMNTTSLNDEWLLTWFHGAKSITWGNTLYFLFETSRIHSFYKTDYLIGNYMCACNLLYYMVTGKSEFNIFFFSSLISFMLIIWIYACTTDVYLYNVCRIEKGVCSFISIQANLWVYLLQCWNLHCLGNWRSCQMCSTYLQNENIDCCIKDKINGLASH